MELIIARNPEPDTSLPFLLRVPLSGGLVFRTKGTWPRTAALYCHPMPLSEWPEVPDVVERIELQACTRRGAAIDVVAMRGREQRSQIVFTRARGREMVFWQSPRTRKQARPDVRLPTARAAQVADLEIIVDAHERYAYKFPSQQVTLVKRALACGDYAVTLDGRVVASVERKSLVDLVSSLISGRLRFALGELATLPRAAVVVEDRYSQIFTLDRVKPAVVADGLAELQVRWPSIPIVFCENRKLAEEWTYRYLAAARVWAADEGAALARIGAPDDAVVANTTFDGTVADGGIRIDRSATHAVTGVGAIAGDAPLARVGPDANGKTAESSSAPVPAVAEIRAWARRHGLTVPDRGRLRPEIRRAWDDAHPAPSSETASP